MLLCVYDQLPHSVTFSPRFGADDLAKTNGWGDGTVTNKKTLSFKGSLREGAPDESRVRENA